MRATPFRKS